MEQLLGFVDHLFVEEEVLYASIRMNKDEFWEELRGHVVMGSLCVDKGNESLYDVHLAPNQQEMIFGRHPIEHWSQVFVLRVGNYSRFSLTETDLHQIVKDAEKKAAEGFRIPVVRTVR